LCRGGERGIFRLHPTPESKRLRIIRRNQRHPRRRRHQRDGGGINNLEDVETKRVQKERKNQKHDQSVATFARRRPIENKRRDGGRVHFGGVVASATEGTPCSRARLATRITISYGV